MVIYLRRSLGLGLLKLLQPHGFGGGDVEKGHDHHFVALGADHSDGRDTLLSGEQGVECEVVILAVKRVLGDVHIATWK